MTKVIREFGTIRIADGMQEDDLDNIWIDEKSFQQLSHFIDENQPQSEIIFSQGKRGGKPYVKVKSYVGIIETKNGTVIEILPKIHTQNESNDREAEKTTRSIFLKMLQTLQDTPFVQIQEAHINIKQFSILEVFIRVFLQELENLVKKGIRSEYETVQNNERFWKGKLNIGEQIKQNVVKPYQFYVEYDDFQASTPANRLIKLCLLKLVHLTKKNENKDKLRHFLHTFDNIDASTNLLKDFSKVSNLNRNYKHYEKTMQWVRVFLNNQSFTNFKGQHLNQALLFPMERLFESYVSSMFKRHAPPQYQVRLQDKQHHLVHSHNETGKFRLKPDIVLTNQDTGDTIVIDCKWKRINENNPKENYGITQSDMYQLFSYGSKYKAQKLLLIYPKHENFKNTLPIFHFYKGTLPLEVVAFDFFEKFYLITIH